jgi:hypothetical protein
MLRTVAPIYWDANIPCNPDLLGYTKYMNQQERNVQWTVREAWTRGRNGAPRRCGWHLMEGDQWAQTFTRKRDAQTEANRRNRSR